MINTAKIFLKANKQQVENMIEYYNLNCVQHVKPSRKYFMKYGDSWCAMFLSVVANMERKSVNEFPYEVSVNKMVEWAEEHGRLGIDFNKLRVGDLIVYNWNGDTIADHVGLVTHYEDGVISVIEGNKDNTVGYRTVKTDSRYIMGFITI